MSDNPANTHGILYPAQLPTFRRVPVTGELATWVRWFWIPEWNIEPGRTSRQHVIGYPACNLVVDSGVAGIAGPSTKASYRDLSGSGWAVGALLRPAAVPAIVGDPAALLDQYKTFDQSQQSDFNTLARGITGAMSNPAANRQHHDRAIAIFTEWLLGQVQEPNEESLLANRMVEAAETQASVVHVSELAQRLHVSTRTLQRLSAKYVGLSPTALIRRRRLQEAASRLRTDPSIDLSELAREFGYADHAHLTNDFRSSLGFTPSDYRRDRTYIGPPRN